jgi:nicotinamide-nucleotide amidase
MFHFFIDDVVLNNHLGKIMTSEKKLLELCIKNSATVSTAESCTGGALSALITSVPGASKIFSQGFIVYSNLAKLRILSISETTLHKYGAVSEQIAEEMAYGCRKIANTTIGISVTGIAGPGRSENKPEGRVCFALSMSNLMKTETMDFGAIGRDEVRRKSVNYCLEMLLSQLETKNINKE